MKITKFEHSGFCLEENGRGLVFDPVEFEQQIPALQNIDVIIITHKHSDHFQSKVLAKILQENPLAKIFTTHDNAAAIPGAIPVQPGDKTEISEFNLEFFGTGNHAEIIPGEIPCENLGVIVNQQVVNPGDSFGLPNLAETKILFVPIAAPWLKTEESVRYIETLRPKIALNSHDGMLSELGFTITNSWLTQKSAAVGTEYKFLRPGEGAEL